MDLCNIWQDRRPWCLLAVLLRASHPDEIRSRTDERMAILNIEGVGGCPFAFCLLIHYIYIPSGLHPNRSYLVYSTVKLHWRCHWFKVAMSREKILPWVFVNAEVKPSRRITSYFAYIVSVTSYRKSESAKKYLDATRPTWRTHDQTTRLRPVFEHCIQGWIPNICLFGHCEYVCRQIVFGLGDPSQSVYY